MDENEIEKLFYEMKDKLYNNEYRKLGIFLHAWSILIESLKFDFISDTHDDIISQFNKNINTIEFELNDDDYSDHYRDDLSWYHRKFHSANSTIFENIYYTSLDKYNEQYINYKENKVKDIIEGLSISFDEYIKKFISLIENFTGFFVKSVTPKDFVNILLNMTNDKLHRLNPHLINLIKLHLHNYFNTNYDLTVWKNEFIGQLTQSISQCKHKLAKHTLNILIDDLKKISS